MFNKRHYEFLARWLNEASLTLYSETDHRLVAHSLADWLALDNSRFDRDRFLVACDALPKTEE